MTRLRRSPDQQWERFGRLDPFFGVLTDERYHRERLTEDTLTGFFETGRARVEDVARMAQAHTGRELRPDRVLDFGCGVGRLLVAFAERAPHVAGVDVSPSMLAETRRHCAERGLDHVELVETRQLSTLAPGFDLVHSHIVFQHIPPKQGYALFEQLAGLLAPGGLGVLHVTLSAPSPVAPAFSWALKHVPLAAGLYNRRGGRPWDYPTMELNGYGLERLVAILHRSGIERVGVVYHPTALSGDRHSAELIFERPVA